MAARVGVARPRRPVPADEPGCEPRAPGAGSRARTADARWGDMMPDLFERQMLRVRNGLAYLTGANLPTVAQSPRDLVWKRDKARLWRYRSGQRRYRPPVLIVHSLVSKSYVLDLLPNTSMVGYLVGEGFDVFLLDWMPPDPADAENTLETYVDDYIPGAIGALLKDAGAREVTLVGYC